MKNHGVFNGVLMGVALIIYTLVTYLIDPSLMFKWWLALIVGIAIYVIFMSRAGIATRTDLGGYISWKQALTPTFLTFVVGALIASIFNYILYAFIDPSLTDQMLDYTMETTENMMRRFGAADSDIEDALAQVEERGVSMGPLDILKQYVFSLILGFIIAAIISAVIKRTKPEEAV